MIDLVALEDRFGEPVQPDVHQQQAERADHRQQPEIRRGEEPGEHDGRDQLDEEPGALRRDRHTGAPDGEAPEPVAAGCRAEHPLLVEGRHACSRVTPIGCATAASRKANHMR